MPKSFCCPFYKAENGLKLSCELVSISFPDKEARREIAYRYCGGKWRACPFAKAMLNYYDRIG